MTSTSDDFFPEQQAPRVVHALKAFTSATALTVLLLGGFGLLRGVFDSVILKTTQSEVAATAPAASLAFLLSGISLWLRRTEQASSLRSRRFGEACAGVVLLMGCLTFLQYILQGGFGTEQHLFQSIGSSPGVLTSLRIPPAIALLFAALSFALLLIDAADKGRRRLVEFLLFCVSLSALAILIGALFASLPPRMGVSGYVALWPTALMLFLLSLAVQSARPERGAIRIVAAEAVGGEVARRLLPAAIVVPPLLCILSYLGFYAKWYNAGLGLAIITTLNSAVFTIIIWRTAGTLNETDARRRSTERQRNTLNDALQQAHAFQELVIESAVFVVAALDSDDRITLINRRMTELTGYTLEEMRGQSFTLLVPEDTRNLAVERLRLTRQTGTPLYNAETQLICKDGSVLTIAYGWSALSSEGQIIGIVGTGEDVTARKKAEEAAHRSQQEIKILNERLRRSMQETHHRVKNNLQIISALAELQVEEAQDTVPAAALIRIGQHTRSLAALHDLLTQEAKEQIEIDSIGTEAAMNKLLPLLQATTGGRVIDYSGENFLLPVQESASLVVLISELISNAVKHGREKIEMTLRGEGNTARLEVCDDGAGFPPNFDWRAAANTGLSLIDSTACYDLRGTIAFENRLEGGARVVVTFPIP